MTLNASGPISIGGPSGQSINLELGRSATAQSSLGESALRTLAGVPSGAIRMAADFYGKSNFSPTTVTYNSGSGTETVPTGATSCRIRIYGGGGGGGWRNSAAQLGGGGGGGGFSEKIVSVTGGDQINYVVGSDGTAAAVAGNAGNSGGQSRVGDVTATGGFVGTNMSANGGGGGSGTTTTGGSGGTATGGTTNTTGGVGVTGNGGNCLGTGGGSGGAAADPAGPTNATAGTAPGGGGGGGNNVASPASGAFGRVEFYYT